MPRFSVAHANGTDVGFFEMVSAFGPGVIVLPIIGLIETISICKTFGSLQYFNSCCCYGDSTATPLSPYVRIKMSKKNP